MPRAPPGTTVHPLPATPGATLYPGVPLVMSTEGPINPLHHTAGESPRQGVTSGLSSDPRLYPIPAKNAVDQRK